MRIIFVGGGAATLVGANLLKRKRPDYEIIIIEKNDKLGRKLAMTGNGKCNIAPMEDAIDFYNNPSFVESLFLSYPLRKYLDTIESLGIPLKTIRSQGYYPLSENAPNVVRILADQLKDVQIINDEVIDYKGLELRLKNKGTIKADKIIFAVGGKSYPSTGSDGALFPVFRLHGYDVNGLKPSLCPVKVKENIKSLFGARIHALVSLMNKEGMEVFIEPGEVMFKKDALSGIAIMNLSSHISHHPGTYRIRLNLLTERPFRYNPRLNNLDNISAFVGKPLAEYIMKVNDINPNEIEVELEDEINMILGSLIFTVDGLYDFDNAQVTNGGISLNEIDDNFMSKREPNIYFIGEMLDVDGICGGFNLRFAITCAMKLVDSL